MCEKNMEIKNENPVEFIPRPYQVELYQASKDRNTIVCLGTGTGKTFIAIMLMKDPKFAHQLRGHFLLSAKRTVFLVPTRPLVKQQAAEIGRHFDVKVGEYTGDMNVDFWNKNRWEEELIVNEVLVMTPQIFLNMLNHAFISFFNLNLLIIDEVHWAAKKKGKKESGHPYKQIMKLYKLVPECSRPRVLGLSASLINSSMKSELFTTAISDLEDTYCAVCNTSNVAKMCGTNPEEVVWSYRSQPSSPDVIVDTVVNSLQIFINYLNKIIKDNSYDESIPMSSTRLKKCLTNIRNILKDPVEKTVKDPETQQEYPISMSWMGVWCASVVIDIYIKEITQYMELYRNLYPNHAKLLEFIINFMSGIKNIFKPKLEDRNSALNTASPKMERLLELLMKYKPVFGQKSHLCGIVFVNQRSVAKVLTEWLIELKGLNPAEYGFINVGWVVGHAARPGFECLISSYSDSKQNETIQNFRDEKLNLLIATSVLEEGLDVRQCNVVIRYDKPKTFREYLQSKGRARAIGAYYYVMTSDEDSAKLQSSLLNFKQMEESIKNLNNKQKTFVENDDENNSSDEEEVYKNASGDARVTTRSAVALLYRYCQKLPSDSFTKLIPNFDFNEDFGGLFGKRYQCSIRLPVNSPIKHVINGEYRKKKNGAKKNAALEVCKQLHAIGELDDKFLPITKEQFIEKYVELLGLKHYNDGSDDSGQRAGTRNRNEIYNKKLAQVFYKTNIESNVFYLNRISVELKAVTTFGSDLITFGAITSRPISNSCSFPVFVKSGRSEVNFVPLNEIEINANQKVLIEKFHCFTLSEVLRLGSDDLKFSPNGSPFFLLLVPLKNEKVIDWRFIEFICKQKRIDLKPVSVVDRLGFVFNKELYKDCVFYPWYRSEEKPEYYNAIEITNMTPKSVFNESKKYNNFEHFYRVKYNIEICNKTQSLVEGKLVQNFAHIKSFVISGKNKKERNQDRKEYFIPELMVIHPFPSSLWRQSLCLPAILYRVNHLFLAEELRRVVHLGTVPRIGCLEPVHKQLKLETELAVEDMIEGMNSSEVYLKRIHSNEDIDDICDGHPFHFDNDSTVNNIQYKPSKKKLRNEFSVIRIESDLRKNRLSLASNNILLNVSSNINSNLVKESVNDFISFTTALINQFDIKLKENRFMSKRLDINALAFDEMDFNSMNAYKTNCPPNYGESFPFIFTGDINDSIRERYDAKNGDNICGPTADLLLNALTLLNANDGFSLERLETIGDSFLKFVTTCYLYYSCPELDEGRLTFLRSIQICNCNLFHIGLQKSITDKLVATKFYPKLNWCPPYYQTSDESESILLTDEKLAFCHHLVSDKSIADSIEALIGAYLLKGGHKSALIFMEWLGLKVSPIEVDFNNTQNRDINDIFRWLPLPKSPIIEHLSEEIVNKSIHRDYNGCNLDHFEDIIGYKFKDKAFLIQAFTHSSYFYNQITDCYQRLEFLGDSVLDYLITRHIFKDSVKFSPGVITDLRSALVNNAFFASIAVKFNFHKFLKVLSPDLFRAIERFVKKFEEDKVETIKNCFTSFVEEEVEDLEEVEVPKALGDIFESVAGAVFLDSGLSLDMVWNVFFKMMKPEIDYFSENVPKMPVRELREMIPSVKFSDSQFVAGRKIRIVVNVNGKEYAGIGSNKKFAKTAASKCALRALKVAAKQTNFN